MAFCSRYSRRGMYGDEVVNMMAIFRWSPGFTFMVARTGSYQTMDCRPESHTFMLNLIPSIFNHECSINKALKQRSRVHSHNNYSRAPVHRASKRQNPLFPPKRQTRPILSLSEQGYPDFQQEYRAAEEARQIEGRSCSDVPSQRAEKPEITSYFTWTRKP